MLFADFVTFYKFIKSGFGRLAIKRGMWVNLEKNLTQTSYHIRCASVHNSSRAEDALRQGEARKTGYGLVLVT
jgi:hypothetical protein